MMTNKSRQHFGRHIGCQVEPLQSKILYTPLFAPQLSWCADKNRECGTVQ